MSKAVFESPKLINKTNMTVHIVTAFFEITSKQPAEFYLKNAYPLLSKCAAQITLFTSLKFAEQFRQMRGDLPMTLIPVEIGKDNLPLDLPIKSVLTKDEWNIAAKKISKRHSWNKNGFSVQLLQLYLSKAWFVEKVIGMNKTAEYEVYMWADIGSCRNPEDQENVYQWPSIHTLRERGFHDNKLIFYQRKEAPREVRSDLDLSSVIAGSHIYGTACAWENVTADISRMVRQHVTKFSGDAVYDETIYFALTLENPEKYRSIRVYWGPHVRGDLGWFETFSQDIKPLITAYVINLSHRTDRWAQMQKNWKGIVDNLIRVDAVYSTKKFKGCALSHIKAIRSALQLQRENKIVLVLEDDAVPVQGLSRETLLEQLSEAQRANDEFDALYLSPLICTQTYDESSKEDLDNAFSKTSTRFLRFSPSRLIICAAMMVYSKRVLNWIEEYEAYINNDRGSLELIPNDRIVSDDSWNIHIYNRPEVWVSSIQVAYVGDSKSDNGGADKISKTPTFKRTPALLKDLAERAQPISTEQRPSKPLRITLLEEWPGGKLCIDEKFTFHSAFVSNGKGEKERIDEKMKAVLFGDSSRRQGSSYKYFADGMLELNVWIGERAFHIEVPKGDALYWEHGLGNNEATVPPEPTAVTTALQPRCASGYGIVAANADISFLGGLSSMCRVYPMCNTRAYLLHILKNYEALDEVTAFLIGDGMDFPVSARSPREEIMALIHEAFAHGYAELSSQGPFHPDDEPRKLDTVIQLSQMTKDSFSKTLLPGETPAWYTMPPIFAVRKDYILHRSKEFYQRALDLIPNNALYSEEQECMDSLWRSVFAPKQPDVECLKINLHLATILAADIGGNRIQERKDATSQVKVQFSHSYQNNAFDFRNLRTVGVHDETIQIKWSYMGKCYYTNAGLADALFS